MGAADFSTTVYAYIDADGPSQCDPMWTYLNGGYCSDHMGNYLRRDGRPVQVIGVDGPDKPVVPGVDNSTMVTALAFLVLFTLGVAVAK